MCQRIVAIIGCGAIGSILANAIDKKRAGNSDLRFLFDMNFERAKDLADKLDGPTKVAKELNEILEDKSVDLVIEAASQEAVIQDSADVLRSGKDLMVMSVGAFSDSDLLKEVRKVAEEAGKSIYLPSGALVGLDGVKAANIEKIDEITLVTRKPPEVLSTTKYVQEQNIDLSNLDRPRTIFESSAKNAVKAFPESVNVAASLSLAGVGFEKTKVKIIADPSLTSNVHEVNVKGGVGELSTKAKNVPSPDNPKTSYLAALSAIMTLRSLTEVISVGT
ncbi:hypothetical protein AKJ43_03755 [candidate division MSBL1 archaeon SCGC-AAA261D19]|uniref:L-aspartate dehydrogenase n=1 Tax=candidate division MSBL1 archaeon SCGC-AAA261D19 TaxID=1698273 RepID=A0A133V3I7_9EURY|nr:hypothetical protein AKJ43_03755 [candidate division MSBL1 archaeon SCGC-AAA261D19]